jgi:hypothetical protein
MELKWILAIGFEAGFWIMLAAFMILRYRYRMEGVTRLFVIGVVLDTLGILALGVWDFAATGEVSAYTVFIAALLGYALTWGKKDLRRFDAWMARKVRPARRAHEPSGTPQHVNRGGLPEDEATRRGGPLRIETQPR